MQLALGLQPLRKAELRTTKAAVLLLAICSLRQVSATEPLQQHSDASLTHHPFGQSNSTTEAGSDIQAAEGWPAANVSLSSSAVTRPGAPVLTASTSDQIGFPVCPKPNLFEALAPAAAECCSAEGVTEDALSHGQHPKPHCPVSSVHYCMTYMSMLLCFSTCLCWSNCAFSCHSRTLLGTVQLQGICCGCVDPLHCHLLSFHQMFTSLLKVISIFSYCRQSNLHGKS